MDEVVRGFQTMGRGRGPDPRDRGDGPSDERPGDTMRGTPLLKAVCHAERQTRELDALIASGQELLAGPMPGEKEGDPNLQPPTVAHTVDRVNAGLAQAIRRLRELLLALGVRQE